MEILNVDLNNKLNDIDVITNEILKYKQMESHAVFEIGKRLKYVKENDLAHGEWEKWCSNSINIHVTQARKYIRVYERFSNRESSLGLGIDALNLLVDFTDEQIEQTHIIPSTGEEKMVNEMTVREIREVKRGFNKFEDEMKPVNIETCDKSQEMNIVSDKIDDFTLNVVNALNNLIPVIKEEVQKGDLTLDASCVIGSKLNKEQQMGFYSFTSDWLRSDKNEYVEDIVGAIVANRSVELMKNYFELKRNVCIAIISINTMRNLKEKFMNPSVHENEVVELMNECVNTINNFISQSFNSMDQTVRTTNTMSEAAARAILGVDESATKKEIRDRMTKLSKQVHPDTSEVFKEDDHFQKLINQAYEILNGGIK